MHPLFVHAAVTAIPLIAIAAIVASLVPRFRRWLGAWMPALATVAFLCAVLTILAGEALAAQVGRNAALITHLRLGDYPAAATFLLMIFAWWQWAWFRFLLGESSPQGQRRVDPGRFQWVTVLTAIVVILLAIATLVATYVAGHTGALAVWGGD